MIRHKYGEFADMQFHEAKEYIRKKIFFLLLVAEDLETRDKFPNVDLGQAHANIMYKLSGLNSILGEPREMVTVLSTLEKANNLILENEFDFKLYRKLILEAGAEVSKICEPLKEVNANA